MKFVRFLLESPEKNLEGRGLIRVPQKNRLVKQYISNKYNVKIKNMDFLAM